MCPTFILASEYYKDYLLRESYESLQQLIYIDFEFGIAANGSIEGIKKIVNVFKV